MFLLFDLLMIHQQLPGLNSFVLSLLLMWGNLDWSQSPMSLCRSHFLFFPRLTHTHSRISCVTRRRACAHTSIIQRVTHFSKTCTLNHPTTVPFLHHWNPTSETTIIIGFIIIIIITINNNKSKTFLRGRLSSLSLQCFSASLSLSLSIYTQVCLVSLWKSQREWERVRERAEKTVVWLIIEHTNTCLCSSFILPHWPT